MLSGCVRLPLGLDARTRTLPVKWDGRYVAGISSVSPLRRTTEVMTYRIGSEPSLIRKLPGRINFEPITLERGVTHDPEFEERRPPRRGRS
jgi:phage tail-like protein